MKNKKLKSKIIPLILGGSLLTLTSGALLTIPTNNKIVQKSQNFYEIKNLDQLDNSIYNNIEIIESNAPTIKTSSGFLIVLRSNEVLIQNTKGETIFTIESNAYNELINLRGETKIFRIFEKNNKLFMISGAFDEYNKQLSSILSVINLENKNLEFITKIEKSSVNINNIISLSENEILLYGNTTTLQDLKSGINSFVYNLESKTLKEKPFNNLDLSLNAEEMKNSYLLNIVKPSNIEKSYAQILYSQDKRTFKHKIIEIKNDKLIKQDNANLQDIFSNEKENKINYGSEQNFQDGEKIIYLDNLEKNFTFLNDEIVIFSTSSYNNSNNIISLFNVKTGQKINDFEVNYETLKNIKSKSSTDNQNHDENLFPQFDNYLKWMMENSRFKILSIAPENNNSFLATIAVEKTDEENMASIYTKGRVLRFSFDDVFQNLTITALEKDGKLLTWLPQNLTFTEDNQKINTPDYFYGFINKIKDNQFIITNGISSKNYLLNVNNQNGEFSSSSTERPNLVSKNGNINFNGKASDFLKLPDEELQKMYSPEMKNISLGFDDFKGEVFINYQLEKNGELINYTEKIDGFKPLTIPYFESDEKFSDVPVSEITRSMIKNSVLKDKFYIDDYIKFDVLNAETIKVTYDDPELKNYPFIVKSQIYTGFKKKENIDYGERVENSLGWDFSSLDFEEIKKYKAKYFDKSNVQSLFYKGTSDVKVNVEAFINEEENNVKLQAKVFLNENFPTIFETIIEDFGQKDKVEIVDPDSLEKLPSHTSEEETKKPAESESEKEPVIEDKPGLKENKFMDFMKSVGFWLIGGIISFSVIGLIIWLVLKKRKKDKE